MNRESSHNKSLTNKNMSPFKSKAQMKAAFGGHLGPVMKQKAEGWAKETPSISKLPERVPAPKGENPLISNMKRAARK